MGDHTADAGGRFRRGPAMVAEPLSAASGEDDGDAFVEEEVRARLARLLGGPEVIGSLDMQGRRNRLIPLATAGSAVSANAPNEDGRRR